MIRQARRINFRECKVGDSASMSLTLTPKLVADFATYSGDYNPLHMDESFAASTPFKRRVVHGMAYGSFISRLIGMDLPGEGALWTSQSFQFIKPVFLGDVLKLTVEITQISEASRTLRLKAAAVNQHGEDVMAGTGDVMALETAEQVAPEAPSKPALVLVTGGSRGIGAAAVEELVKRGHPVAFTYHSRAEEAHALCERLRAKDGKVWSFAYKAEDGARASEALIRAVRSDVGDPTALVCSGASPDIYGTAAESSWEQIDRQLQIHVASVLHLTQALLPGMTAARSGSVILLGTSYLLGAPPANMVPYMVAKHALNGLFKSLAIELGPKQIRVNMVSPSMTETELLARVPQRTTKVAAQQNPLRRLANPADVASSIGFLCSSDAAYINGHNLVVSGGSAMV